MTRRRQYAWYRPTAREVQGETLRRLVLRGWISGAMYPLPAAERQTDRGIVPEAGFTLVFGADPGLLPGDILRDGGHAYEVAVLRLYPAHAEAVLAERLTNGEEAPYDR